MPNHKQDQHQIMHLKFLGAARTVTGSCHVLELEDGFTIMLDCGMYQGNDQEFDDFNKTWLCNPSDIDCVILSHAHIDHCGRIPRFIKDGFSGKIFCTSATRDLASIMLMDSAKIQERDAEYINRKKADGEKKVEPLYRTEDVFDTFSYFVGVGYNKWHSINERVSFCLKDAGHIFGSASITLKIKKNDGNTISLGFTGDTGRPGRPVLKDPVPMKDLDYLISESTYGGQNHNKLPYDEEALLGVIEKTCVKQNGKLLIPAFSLGRTQEIVYILNGLEHSGKLPEIPVFVDSPLAVNATDIYRLYPECFDSDTMELMIEDPDPFGFNRLNYIRSVNESKRLNTLKGPAIIISASGMMTGGRILHHLLNHAEEDRNTILIVGYCAPGTLGARIRNGEKKVRVFNVPVEIRADVVIMDSFSAHGDQGEMLDYLGSLDREKLRKIFLVHGDYDRQQLFEQALLNNGFGDVVIPELGDEFELN